jgi:hypothetical protein
MSLIFLDTQHTARYNRLIQERFGGDSNETGEKKITVPRRDAIDKPDCPVLYAPAFEVHRKTGGEVQILDPQ